MSDASPDGVEAVLYQIQGKLRTAFRASATLVQAERRYAQFERKAFAVILVLQEFHKYIYILQTFHIYYRFNISKADFS